MTAEEIFNNKSKIFYDQWADEVRGIGEKEFIQAMEEYSSTKDKEIAKLKQKNETQAETIRQWYDVYRKHFNEFPLAENLDTCIAELKEKLRVAERKDKYCEWCKDFSTFPNSNIQCAECGRKLRM